MSEHNASSPNNWENQPSDPFFTEYVDEPFPCPQCGHEHMVTDFFCDNCGYSDEHLFDVDPELPF